MKVSEVYPSKWLAPGDVTRPVTVEIASTTVEEFRQRAGNTEPRIVLTFVRAKKRMILNKTQATALATLFGDEANAWLGQKIQLAPGRAPNNRDTIIVMAAPQVEIAEPTAS